MRMVRSPKWPSISSHGQPGLSLNGQRDASRLAGRLLACGHQAAARCNHVCVWKEEEEARVVGRERQVQIPLDNECVCYVSGHLRVPAMHAFKQYYQGKPIFVNGCTMKSHTHDSLKVRGAKILELSKAWQVFQAFKFASCRRFQN